MERKRLFNEQFGRGLDSLLLQAFFVVRKRQALCWVYVDRLHRGALLSYCVVVHDALVLVAGTCGTFFRRGGKSYYIRVQVHGREVVGGFGSSWRSRNLDRRFARDRAISNSSKSGLDVVAGRMSKTGDVPVVISENLSAVDTSSSDNVKARPQVIRPLINFCPKCGGAMEQRIPEGGGLSCGA
ncbi:uncharacterized protein [Physcomitrium patens]|uniref:uncharacterized protein n=1 Tax=Physcomitrium patens TaxID=3218 RepID=UPI003CCD2298